MEGFLFGGFWNIIGILLIAFWLWMLIDCIRNEPNKVTWLLILILLNILGAIIYWVVRKLPEINNTFDRGNTRQVIRSLESQVIHLDNAYYRSKLGEVYLDARNVKMALLNFEKALEFEPDNISALLGKGECLVRMKKYNDAVSILEISYKKDPNHRMGKGGELLLDCYYKLGNNKALHDLLQELQKKNQSYQIEFYTAYFMIKDKKQEQAKEKLRNLIKNIKLLSRGDYYRHKNWLLNAKHLLRQTILNLPNLSK